jgi:hypothetical protein
LTATTVEHSGLKDVHIVAEGDAADSASAQVYSSDGLGPGETAAGAARFATAGAATVTRVNWISGRRWDVDSDTALAARLDGGPGSLAGSRMRLHGLAARPELNGCIGEVEGGLPGDRIAVRLGAPHHTRLSLKRSNLERLDAKVDGGDTALRKTDERDVGPQGALARQERSLAAARHFGEWHPALAWNAVDPRGMPIER